MSFSLCASDVRVEFHGAPTEVESSLRAVWRHAAALLPIQHRVVYRVVEREGGYAVLSDGEERAASVSRANLLALLEGILYRDITAWTPRRRTLFHAGAVHLDGFTYVLMGDSGAGKSTLSYALVERGGLYLTDELTLFEGEFVWGIPRAPQLDPVAPGTPLPSFLPKAEFGQYVFESVDGPRDLPLLPLSADQVASQPYPTRSVRLVFPRRAAEDSVHPLSATEALRRLHCHNRTPIHQDFGPLLTRASVELDWSDRSHAVEILLGVSPGSEP